jgi:hypothetical protein
VDFLEIDSLVKEALANAKLVDDPEATKKYIKAITKDTTIERAGNKYAFDIFMAKKQFGYYFAFHIKHANPNVLKHLHESAVVSEFKLVNEAMKNTVVRSGAKLFRLKHDEGVVYVADHNAALHFAQALKNSVPMLELDILKGSISVGMGDSYQAALTARNDADNIENGNKINVFNDINGAASPF